MSKEYKGFKLEDIVSRKGALEILKAPSRIYKQLYYPDGVKKSLAKDEPKR